MALFFAVPIGCALVVLREPLISVLFERGSFSAAATIKVARLFALLILLMPAGVASSYFVKALYALQEMWWPRLPDRALCPPTAVVRDSTRRPSFRRRGRGDRARGHLVVRHQLPHGGASLEISGDRSERVDGLSSEDAALWRDRWLCGRRCGFCIVSHRIHGERRRPSRIGRDWTALGWAVLSPGRADALARGA